MQAGARRLGGALLACAALLGCHARGAADDALRVGVSEPPATLDPRFATDAASVRIGELVHCALVRTDRRFAVVPALAASWTMTDPYTLRMHLRDGFRFHDGRPVEAADAAATLRAILAPGTRSPLAGLFRNVRAVEAPDAHTLVLRLARPEPGIVRKLGVGVLPRDEARTAAPVRRPAGCGPYRIARLDDGGVLLARVRGAGPARIRFVVVRDPTTRALKLAHGELDLVQGDVPAHLLPFFRKRGLRVVAVPSNTFSYIGFNLRRPPLSDRRVRRALAMAVPRRAIAKALFGGLPQPAETVLPEEHPAGVRLAPIPYDPEAAGRLLDEAGWPRREDGVRFALVYRTSTNPERLAMAEAIQAAWRRIGVDARIESLEWGAFYARIKRGDFDAYSLSWVGVSDPEIYYWILHSSMVPPAGANRGGYRDPEVDRWLEEARGTLDARRRRALYRRVARRMHEDVVYAPLWREPVIAVLGPRVAAYRPWPDGGFRGLLGLRLQSPRQRQESRRAAR